MNVRTLPANQHFAVPYNLSTAVATATSTATSAVSSQLSALRAAGIPGRFRYNVISEFPVSVFLMDAIQLDAFRKGISGPNSFYARSEGQRHDQYFPYIPSMGPIYLVIANFGNQPTAVYYNVFNG